VKSPRPQSDDDWANTCIRHTPTGMVRNGEPIAEQRPTTISEREPVFPCWLWSQVNRKWEHSAKKNSLTWEWSDVDYTHWLPDQPTAPTATPTATPARKEDAS